MAQRNPSQQVVKTRLPQAVRRQVRRDLANRLNVPRRDLRVTGFSQETWPDSCLGLAAPNERCAMALVEGWRVEVSNGQQSWFYRTDQTAQVIKPETMDNADLPPDVIDRLLQTVAQEADVPASSLRITETQPRIWDGCMGIYVPDQACTRIAISGWQVIVAGDNQSWVYHISEDGSRIVQNATASGSSDDLVPSFIPTDGQPSEPVDQTIVFRSTVSGGLAGNVFEIVLMNDGTLYRQDRRFNDSQSGSPVVEKRLSAQEVQQFQQLLQDQRFPNLDGLRYITDAALADYPTTSLYAMGSTVQYIDLEADNLPPALQAVLQAWGAL
ncbi:hypothetical protein IQ268_05365 [Oculatella sp. LEGE 06141]|uniref:hypothetical protein n=1 Tax=Oculatella sp. LEGE 06141 TaxID=1828648 RepID=UPI0018815E52|nr:hypothetical protein [Oculatella sp. LEGE 06141]MBE9178013.1 hypothetical protein [Oculatella sp. LEGE 06141]